MLKADGASKYEEFSYNKKLDEGINVMPQGQESKEKPVTVAEATAELALTSRPDDDEKERRRCRQFRF